MGPLSVVVWSSFGVPHMVVQVQFYCQLGQIDSQECAAASVNQGTASDFIVEQADLVMQRILSGNVEQGAGLARA